MFSPSQSVPERRKRRFLLHQRSWQRRLLRQRRHRTILLYKRLQQPRLLWPSTSTGSTSSRVLAARCQGLRLPSASPSIPLLRSAQLACIVILTPYCLVCDNLWQNKIKVWMKKNFVFKLVDDLTIDFRFLHTRPVAISECSCWTLISDELSNRWQLKSAQHPDCISYRQTA